MLMAKEQRASGSQEWIVSSHVPLSDVEEGLVCSSVRVLCPQSHREDHDIVSGPSEHLQAGTHLLRLDMKFRLNLDLPNLSYFMGKENRKGSEDCSGRPGERSHGSAWQLAWIYGTDLDNGSLRTEKGNLGS